MRKDEIKVITAAQLQVIRDAYESIRGTNQYCKYHMEHDFKDNKGKWQFLNYGVPYQKHDLKVKRYRDTLYIMTPDDERYVLTDAVLELIGIEK